MNRKKEYEKERDAVLLEMDLDKVIAFQQRTNPGYEIPPRDLCEIGMHKARSALTTLPIKERAYSKKWLLDRGFKSHDDGDVPLPKLH